VDVQAEPVGQARFIDNLVPPPIPGRRRVSAKIVKPSSNKSFAVFISQAKVH
jgi:hypothetical protein